MLVAPKLPAGLYRNGTVQQAEGRWYDANLVRFYQGAVFPIGGWAARSASAVSGAARAVITWASDTIARRIGIGTHTKLEVMDRAGTLYDITPAGFTAGHIDATTGGGYGAGTYGSGTYGTPRLDTGTVIDATVWSLDTWGQYLVGGNADDGKLYEWQLNTATPAAAISGAPTSNRALLVTEEGFLLALGAGGNPRLVQWCDQRDNTAWTPTTTNQAGDYELLTAGRIMCGRRTRGAHLIFTDQDVHQGLYQGPPYVYSFQRIGAGCGIISQAAAIDAGDLAFWMGTKGFWLYNGTVQPLPCDVWDYVFNDLNQLQKSKVWAEHNHEFGECTWQYPSGSATEIDRYVTFNYRENTWSFGLLTRLCGVASGVFEHPIRISDTGLVYEHENGLTYDDMSPFVESGPMELGEGDNSYTVLGLKPDERTVGQVQATFYARNQPDGAETTFGPYTLTTRNRRGLVDLRFTTRETRLRLTGAQLADWRAGPFKLDIAGRGKA